MEILKKQKKLAEFAGELLGTFILVFFGCGVVAASILFDTHLGLFQVAMVWGLGVALAIYVTRHLSCAHLNPAVTIAMIVSGRMKPCKFGRYVLGQFIGAFLAAVLLYVIFNSTIIQFEAANGIIRGTAQSISTAAIFGEFYPNPSSSFTYSVTMWTAFCVESVGTFFLVFMILTLTDGCNIGRPDDTLVPLFIGLTITVIISVIAPLTQAGINPARDLAPRIFAWLAGWGKAAFPAKPIGALVVYVFGPISGSIIAALLFQKIVRPMLMVRAKDVDLCCSDSE
ncbi:aquaporin family protein [bacterium]|nr:aquaporin family protein [bacterium]